MILMREGLQHCLMRLWNNISQLTFVFLFAETRSIKQRICDLTDRISNPQHDVNASARLVNCWSFCTTTISRTYQRTSTITSL